MARQVETLEQIAGIAKLILRAPRTSMDPHAGARIHHLTPLIVRYLATAVGDCIWLNHLTLAALLLAAQGYDQSSIYAAIAILHRRLRAIATSDRAPKRLRSMKGWGWNLTAWMEQYLRGELCDDSLTTRKDFWRHYQGVARIEERWLAGLSVSIRSRYRPFVLPTANPTLLTSLIPHRAIQDEQKRRRKEETDALMPSYPQLRSEAHLRYNRFCRLRQAYQGALRAQNDHYPHDFSYVEDGRRYNCRIWNSVSFTAHMPAEHCHLMRGPAPANFLELRSIEEVSTGRPLRIDEEWWFAEPLRHALCHKATNLPEVSREWLVSWGYAVSALWAPNGGLTYWLEVGFMRRAQQFTAGLLIPVDELYRALSFGLLALDLFTTTGARLNEVMQVSFDPECLVRLVVPAPIGADDPRPRIRYLLRLLPKGERKDQLHDYFIGEETKRLLVRTGQMLAEHYEAGDRGAVPAVPFHPLHRRAHRFGVKPYVFQLYGKHLNAPSISVCLRVLVHGVVLRTRSGRTISIRPHLLRHAFATHAVQVEKIPVDIVGYWLHQKHLDTTAYYAQATETMAADAADGFLARIAANIDVGRVVTRSAPELLEMYREAMLRSGTLANVPGGSCTSHGFCKVHFTCIGCPAKVPDPSKRDQVRKKVEWAERQIEYYRREGLTAEVHSLEQLLRAAAEELQEMDQIEHFRRDEARHVEIADVEHSAP